MYIKLSYWYQISCVRSSYIVWTPTLPHTSWLEYEFVLNPGRFIILRPYNEFRTPLKPEVNFLFLTDSRFVEMLLAVYPPTPFPRKGRPPGHTRTCNAKRTCVVAFCIRYSRYYCDFKLNFERQSFFNVTNDVMSYIAFWNFFHETTVLSNIVKLNNNSICCW